LQRYALQPEKLLAEAAAMFSELLIERHPQIAAANAPCLPRRAAYPSLWINYAVNSAFNVELAQ